jgi:hypothetical protein
VFSVLSVPRCYEQGSESPSIVPVTEAGENSETQRKGSGHRWKSLSKTEKIICAVVTVNFGVCNSVRLS